MQRELADGLVLRTLSEGVASDRERLPAFYGTVNGEGDSQAVFEGLCTWTQDLINHHPQTSHDDIFVVVDPAHDDRIVSATLLIPQTWRYEEIPIAVGRPELVGTLPEYRARGLVRTLFNAVHERSAALGHQIQTITGIPYFYRQFGYTMALDLDEMATFPLHVPADPPPDTIPDFTLRAATTEDIADLSRWHNEMAATRLVTELRSPEEWRHEVVGHNHKSSVAKSYLIVVNNDGMGVGYIELGRNLFNRKKLYCYNYVIGQEASYLETFDDVMLAVRRYCLTEHGECPHLMLFGPGAHPALYQLVVRRWGGSVRQHGYKWYVRVADPIAFLRHIQPVLERRLEGSGANRYTGELKVGFYNLSGIALHFERGRIVDIITVQGKDGYDASFPWHLFWNIVFGDQTLDEIDAVVPDARANRTKGYVLLSALFPKKQSWVTGLS
jgi:hypothetical protein